MTRILHIDSRQKIYHKEFGDISTDISVERLFIYQNIVEPIGGINCVAISGCKACSSQTGRVYDYQSSFNYAPHTATGMYPPDWFRSIVKRGLQRLDSVLFDSQWRSYWSANLGGSGDAFDNTISAMNHANSACTVWSNYYSSWNTQSDVLPQGSGGQSEHDWIIAGWKQVNGITMLIVDFHTGRTYYMPREVFNVEVSRLGCGTGIPATTAIAAIEKRSLMQYIIDLCQNCILLLKQLQVGTFPPSSTELAWDTRGNCSHSVRVLCDKSGLTVNEKNIIWACVKQESNFLTNPKPNENMDDSGHVWSTDYGIVQINDYYHIGKGKDFPSVQCVLDNPQACVQWMIDMYKEGKLYMWSSYSTGAYLTHLPYTPII